MNKELQLKFDDDLNKFLIERLGEASEVDCRFAALSLIRLSIEVIFQNSPNKKDFEKNYIAIVSRIFTMWKEALKEEYKNDIK
jgi:RNAse (barnase) inhibitor barstar